MAQERIPAPPYGGSSGSAGSTGVAERGADSGTAVRDAAGDMTTEAKQQVRQVTDEVGTQARELYQTTATELRDQAQARTERAAEGLRTLSGQIRALAEGRRDEAGRLNELASQAQTKVTQLADRLESGGVEGLLDDVKHFARRRPLVFVAACASAGFLLGRMGRAARNESSNGASHNGDRRFATGDGSAYGRPQPEPMPLTTPPVARGQMPGQTVPGSTGPAGGLASETRTGEL